VSKPYYSDNLVQLYHGDCREITEWLTADVLVTDPPYGIGYESNRNRDKRNEKQGRPIAGDVGITLRDYALDAWKSRPAIVFGRWDIPRPDNTRVRLIWDKGNSAGLGDLSLPWGRSDEEIYVLGSGFVGVRSGSVLRVQMYMSGDKKRPDHPTPKPVPLMELLVTKCPPGVIADPYSGSGATLIAASNLGRPSIGVEVEERYCELIARRLDQGVLSFEDAS
jgi:site-specific DNA-methyltransferase (adenine-specific)